MKAIKSFSLVVMLAVCGIFLAACGEVKTDIQLGTYSGNTFTQVTDADYALEVNGTNLKLTGDIPYSASVAGVEAGNIVAIRFVPETELTADDETSIKTTNRQKESGWNEYDKTALESDGSIVWVTSVSKENSVQIKIKWNKDTPETTYTLTVADNATLLTA